MRRLRRIAIVLLALGLVTGAIYATGAFTSLTAQRDANVAVTGDASAYLSLKPASGPNGEYARYEHGQLQVVLGETTTEDGATGSGVNVNAVTTVNNVFTITNHGSQTVGLWLTDGSDAVTFEIDGQSIEAKGNAITIEPGTTKPVSLVVDTRQVKTGTDLLKSVTFHSSAAVSGVPAQSGSGTGSEPPTSVADGSSTATNQPERSSTPQPKPNPKSQSKPQSKQSTEQSKKLVGFLKKHPSIRKTITTVLPVGGVIEWAYKNPKQATKFIKGALWGEMGMPDGMHFDPDCTLTDFGCTSRSTASSPWYLIGWLSISTIPGVDIAADVRDAIQNAKSGDTAEFVLDVASILPGLGKAGDLGQIVNYTKKWSKLSSVSDEAVALLSKHILQHVPDSTALKLLDIFTDGKASKLHEKGVSVDRIIRGAQNGKLDDLRRSDNGKRLVTDGGTPKIPDSVSQKALNNKLSEAKKYQGGKLTEPLTKQDILRAGHDTDGEVIYLTDTAKWMPKKVGLREVPDWRHIVARHVHPKSKYFDKFKRTDEYPVKPAQKADEGRTPTMFHKAMAPNEIQTLIMKSAKNGEVVERKPFRKIIEYDVPKNSKYNTKYGMKKMKVVIRKKSGLVKTAYPIKGGVKYDTI
jgi:hypothetical protein